MRYRDFTRHFYLIFFSLLLLLFVFTVGVRPTAAQVVPHQYRLSRTVAGQTPQTHVFLKSAMVCGVPRGMVAGFGLRINDPENDALDCEYINAGNVLVANIQPGVAYSYTIAGGTQDGRWGPESTPVSVGTPGAPGGLRVQPSVVGVQVLGTVQQRFPFAGLDVATARLDGSTVDVYLGAQSLAVPGYQVRPGDRVHLALWRER